MTQIKLLHLGTTCYSLKLGKSDSYSILFDKMKVPNAISYQIHLSSLIDGQVQSHNNRHILLLVNLNCSHLTLQIYTAATLQIYTAAVSPLPRPP